MKRRFKIGRKPRNTAGRTQVNVNWAKEHSFPVPIPSDESERVAELKEFDLLDTPPEELFDSITLLASHICRTPIALVTLVDSDRQWFKSKVGVTLSETSRDIALCAHAIMEEDLFIVPDASRDKRFAGNPLVRSKPRIRFYAGAPLISRNHHALGTLCVIDRVPRQLDKEQREALRALSRQVMVHLESRRRLKLLQSRIDQHANDMAGLMRQINLANARKRAFEEKFRRLRHGMRATNKAVINLLDQVMAETPGFPLERNLRSIRCLAQSLLELAR
jgi:GAF domain-containing protein